MCLTERLYTPRDSLNEPLNDLTHLGIDPENDHCDYINFENVSSLQSSSDDLIAIQLNVRGLISKQAILSNLLTTCMQKQKIDLVLLCETWLTPDIKPLVNIPGYIYVGDEHTGKKGGGIGMLLARESQYKIRTELNVMDENLECFFIELFTKGRNILCGSAYRPPNTNTKTFLNKMTSVMGKIKLETHKDVVLGMDHN